MSRILLLDRRTVLSCRNLFALSSFQGGSAVHFFVGWRRLPVFGTVFFGFSGRVLRSIFESDFLFLMVCPGFVFFGGVLPMFLFCVVVFRAQTRLAKIIFMSGFPFGGGSFFCLRVHLCV